MRIGVILLFLLFIPIVYSQEEYQNHRSLNLDTKISSQMSLDPGVNYLSSELYFFPKETEFQEIIEKKYSDDVIARQDYITYEWSDPGENLEFYLDYRIKSDFNFVEIKNKIPYPIKVPPEYEEYLKSTELINSNNILIRKQADDIVKDEDDLYEVVYKIASWAKDNINYSLETLTEEVTQNSVWVLENKKGVCDELTVLFIAMLRSKGIPAKFVSGQSYTNVIPGFGNHAWAEVYFPGKGWVPFDVTYGQYGYVDASHIKMRESSDAKEPSVRYRWSPGGKNIEIKPINISTKITSVSEKLPQYININFNLLKNQVKSGSYVPIEIEVENTKDFYLPTVFYITKAPSSVEDNLKHVLLKPNEKKKIYWMIKIPDNLDDRYIYTSKIEIVDFFGASKEKEVEYSNKYSYYSIEESLEKIRQLEIENRNPESNIDVFCFPDQLRYYTYENATLKCRVSNYEEDVKSMKLCFTGGCRIFDISKNEEKEFSFGLPVDIGKKEYHAELSNSVLIKSYYFDVNVIETPDLTVDNVISPEKIDYKGSSEIRFDISAKSSAKNLVVYIGRRKLFSFDVYEGAENFVVPFNGKYFYNDENKRIILEYEDGNGVKYNLEKELVIEVEGVPFYVRIGYWWILIIAFIIVLFVFRKRSHGKDIPRPVKKKFSKT